MKYLIIELGTDKVLCVDKEDSKTIREVMVEWRTILPEPIRLLHVAETSEEAWKLLNKASRDHYDVYGLEPRTRVCSRCGGSGKIFIVLYEETFYERGYFRKCDVCKGNEIMK